jgi:hypothetical protein
LKLLSKQAMLRPSMRGLCRILILLIAAGFLSPLAFGQSSLGKTTLGKSQNSSEDLVNSLIPGPQRFGKGEKKAEVDPKTLQSKTIKDPTFQGSLNDVGLDWNGSTMGKSRATGETDSKSAKQPDTDTKKAPAKSTEASENAQGKESKSTSSKPDKQPEKQPDKGKSSDTGGNH